VTVPPATANVAASRPTRPRMWIRVADMAPSLLEAPSCTPCVCPRTVSASVLGNADDSRQAVDEADTWMVQPPVQPAFNTGPLREFEMVLPLIVTGATEL